MTQEEKSLLLRDLCARLPYGVKVCAGEDLAMTLKQIDYKCFCESWENEDFKCHSRWMLPYLRPMSSMTEEEINEFHKLRFIHVNYGLEPLQCVLSVNEIDWLNAHHFDYRGLIEKGLAIAVTKENNLYKNEND